MKRLVPISAIILLLTIIFLGSNIEVGIGHLWYGILNKKTVVVKEERRGTLEEKTFHSKIFNLDRKYIIYLPPDYQTEDRRYPVLYLLHGFAGSYNDWVVNASLSQSFDKFINSGQLPPIIAVFPDGSGPLHTDSQYIDATLMKQPMATHIINEFVPLIDSEYRTIASCSARAIGGLSAGGYGAANLALHNSNIFNYVLSISGYFLADDPAMKKLIGKDNGLIKDNSPLAIIESADEVPLLHYFITAGEEDGKYLESTKNFAVALSNKKQDYVIEIGKGWHTWGNWREMIDKGLIWLGGKWQIYK